MKYKILIGLVLLASANFLYLIATRFFLKPDYENYLLVVNGVLIFLFAIGDYWEQKNIEAQKNTQVQLQNHVPPSPPPQSFQINDQNILEHIPDFLCLKDKDGRWLRASQSYLEIFNLQGTGYIGKTDIELAQYPNSNVRALKLSVIQDKSAWYLREQVKETRAISYLNKPDKTLEIVRTPIFDSHKNKLKLILTGRFVDYEEKEMSKLELVSYGFQMSHLSLLFLDEGFRISAVNNAFSVITGHSMNELEGKHLSYVILSEDGTEQGPAYADFFKRKDEKFWFGELICRRKNGSIFPIRLDITEIKKENQQVMYFASVIDITQQKQSEKRMMQIAHYDDLTGLVNRSMFFYRLSQFLSGLVPNNLHAIIFFVDLDRFKGINDSLGHDAGDELLKQTAARLVSVVGGEDTVARLSGDEFALLMFNEATHEQAVYSASMVAEKIIQKLSEVFHIQRREVFVGASIGITIYPEDGRSAEVLLKNADISMYEAKKQGHSNYQFFKKDDTSVSQDRLMLEMNLRKAIEKNELQLYYQPQYKANTRELCGAEVLVRWFHGPTGQQKMIPPDNFIPMAEETGLIIEIGKWILRTSCLQLKRWMDEGLPLKQVSVNVSARQFNDNNFLKSVEDALKDSGLPSKHLELEITESMLIGDTKQIELQLKRLKNMGVTIVLDDFGTGYSSLSYLKNFPIDVLKIDQSFVKGSNLQSKNARIASAIINMGHALGQKIVAEGVETEQQLLFLSQRGCDIIQGYYFSPPLPEFKMTALMRTEGAYATQKETKALFE